MLDDGIMNNVIDESQLSIPNFLLIDSSCFWILSIGMIVSIIGVLFGIYEYVKIKRLKSHSSMLYIGELIFETCKTYLLQQGKFLIILEIIIGFCIFLYFGILENRGILAVLIILSFSIIGILGSYCVAWFGIRINTVANTRTAFHSLRSDPFGVSNIPTRAGMSIGVFLVSIELIIMIFIMLILPIIGFGDLAGYCFIGFAIGESLGASVLRVAGGIFTKIADIGSDLMKIILNIKEDDPRNPGVIADCTGDNAGDSVGPTADGFETYGVTGVAIITFIILGVEDIHTLPSYLTKNEIQVLLLTWIFTMRYLMIITSIISYWINNYLSKILLTRKNRVNFESPLTNFVWITSILSIIMTFAVTYLMIPSKLFGSGLWLVLSLIISCGTLGAALIPELTKRFTSPNSQHTKEVVLASKEGGASLNILSGLVAGNFSAFWITLTIIFLMIIAYIASNFGLGMFMSYPSILAFGLVAFGFLGMGPVTIAVDSYGPVTDNAQSIYELSMIESQKNIKDEIKKEYGFEPNFENAKELLEENDGAGNTFKATAKPVLIATAVVGATTMIFSMILMLRDTLGIQPENILNLLNPFTIIGLLCGGMVIYWFTGASIQSVIVGAYRVVIYIKEHIVLDSDSGKADIKTSKEVVKICTIYAQKGMFNIFIAIFCFTLSFAFFSSPFFTEESVSLFISFLISIAIFGLLQAVFMANAGGCWDNAKKIVEVNLKQKNTDLHNATIIGDTVGDPYKDTSSVAMNPIIKFTTLFGILAMKIALNDKLGMFSYVLGILFLITALIFVWRSFYSMKIQSIYEDNKELTRKIK